MGPLRPDLTSASGNGETTKDNEDDIWPCEERGISGRSLCDRFGLNRAGGQRLELVDGRYSGEVAEQFDELSKRDFAAT